MGEKEHPASSTSSSRYIYFNGFLLSFVVIGVNAANLSPTMCHAVFPQLVSVSFSICVATIAPTKAKRLGLRVDVGETVAYGRACTAGCYALGFTSRDVVIWSRHFVIQAGCAAKECGRRRDATGSSGMRSRLLLSAPPPPRVGCPGCPLWVISGPSRQY